jgi:hypothetical protein
MEDGGDSLGTVPLSAVNAGAFDVGLAPIVDGGEIFFPKRPCAALAGAHRIHLAAAGMFVFTWQKNAVFAGFFLNEGLPQSHAPAVAGFEVLDRYAQMVGHGLNFVVVDPDIAFIRAGAATAALLTLKGQTILPPGFIFHINAIG